MWLQFPADLVWEVFFWEVNFAKKNKTKHQWRELSGNRGLSWNQCLSLHEQWKFTLRISSVNVKDFCELYTAQHCTKNEVFYWGFLQQMWPADLVTFTEESLHRKLHFLCSVNTINELNMNKALQKRHTSILMQISKSSIWKMVTTEEYDD